jgi:hypothetical protein
MKRVQYLRYGGPEELRLDEVKPLASAGPRQEQGPPGLVLAAAFWRRPAKRSAGQGDSGEAADDASHRVRLPCARPLGVGMPRSFSAVAMARSDVAPAACISRIAGVGCPVVSALLYGLLAQLADVLADRQVARAAKLDGALAAASAAFVRAEIMPASSSATAAICCSMNRPVGPSICGRSQNSTSTPASRRALRKATERRSTSPGEACRRPAQRRAGGDRCACNWLSQSGRQPTRL